MRAKKESSSRLSFIIQLSSILPLSVRISKSRKAALDPVVPAIRLAPWCKFLYMTFEIPLHQEDRISNRTMPSSINLLIKPHSCFERYKSAQKGLRQHPW